MDKMPLKSEEELEQLLADAKQQVPKGLYRHSGNEKKYLVIDYAIHRYSGEACIIYEAQYGKHLRFVRTLREWFKPEMRDGKEVVRFVSI